MAIRRIKPLDSTKPFDLALVDMSSNILEMFADFAISEKNRVMNLPVKRPSRVTTTVGGRKNADEHSVKMGESIVYDFDYIKAIIIDAHKRLKQNSPVDRSAKADKYRYRDSHIIIAGGQAYDDPEMVPDDVAGEIIITNLMPYARKVENRGWGTAGSGGFHVPYHTYELTATELKRYSNFVNIKFTFVDMPGFAAASAKSTAKKQSSMGAVAFARWQSQQIRYPALIITTR